MVREVEERYLLVDALRIVQDVKDKEKQNQIETMDWLYGRAAFTIVAADGENSMAGLPSVRVESRHLRQETGQISPGTRLLSPIISPKKLDGSVWDSRGWTLKERLLSRRLLTFQGAK